MLTTPSSSSLLANVSDELAGAVERAQPSRSTDAAATRQVASSGPRTV